MRVARGIVALAGAALFTCLVAGPAKAQECVKWSAYSCADQPKPGAPKPAPDAIDVGVITPKDEVEPDVRKLYRVDVACNAPQRLPAASQGIFNRSDLVTSHIVAITGKPLTGTELPTDAKILIPVYSVSTAKANQSNFTNKACNQSFFVSGREPLFIAATTNQTRSNSPSALSNLLYGGLKLFNPIWPLFAGATAVAAVQPILNGIAATEAPLKEMFSKFDSKGTQTYSYPLYLGETNIRTPYSRTTVTVKEVPSVIQTENGKFIISFEDSLKGFWEEIRAPALDVKSVVANCRSYSRQLVAKNFPAEDVIYGLSYITRPAGLDTEKSVACLGKEYGLRSVDLFTCPPPGIGLKCLWNRFSKDALTADNFKDPYPPQKYDARFFKGLVNAMADYAAAGPSGNDATRAALAGYFQDSVELEDFERLVQGKDGQVSPAAFMQQMVESGFTKFGCDVKDTQAAGLLFAFPPAPAADGLYHGEDLVALRTWRGEQPRPGEPEKVFKVEALFQPGLAEAAAKPTLMWCGKGLHLAKTSEPEKAESEKKDEPAGAGGQ